MSYYSFLMDLFKYFSKNISYADWPTAMVVELSARCGILNFCIPFKWNRPLTSFLSSSQSLWMSSNVGYAYRISEVELSCFKTLLPWQKFLSFTYIFIFLCPFCNLLPLVLHWCLTGSKLLFYFLLNLLKSNITLQQWRMLNTSYAVSQR